MQSNGLEHNGPPVDDDYAEIGEQDAIQVKFDPMFEIDRNSIQILGSPIGRGQFGNVYKASFNKTDIKQLVAVKSSHCQDESTGIDFTFDPGLLRSFEVILEIILKRNC